MYVKKLAPFDPGADPALSAGGARHGRRGYPSPHRGFSRAVEAAGARPEVLHGHRQRRGDLHLVGHGRDGSRGIQSVLRRATRLSWRRPASSASAGCRSPRAFGLDVTVIEEPYGDAVAPERVAEALARRSRRPGCIRTGDGNFDRRFARRQVDGEPRFARRTRSLWWTRITGLGTSQLDIDGWGLDVVIGGSQKAVMIPPGLAFASVSQKAWERREQGQAAATTIWICCKHAAGLGKRRIAVYSGDFAAAGAGRGTALHPRAGPRKSDRERATAGARHARGGRGARPGAVRATQPVGRRDCDPPAEGDRFRRDRQGATASASAPSSPTARAR